MLLILAILIGFTIIFPDLRIPILDLCLYVLSPLGFFGPEKSVRGRPVRKNQASFRRSKSES